jgi:organic hydroperoxide reductase OsmC/OhrA
METSSHHYTVDLSWTEQRKGVLSSESLHQSFEVATPPDFPKGHQGIWSPEHLFIASASSCLMTTFLAIAENFKLSFISFVCPAEGQLDTVEGLLVVSQITLKPIVSVSREEDIALAEKVLQKAKKACLIANSMKTTIFMKPTIEVIAQSLSIHSI